MSSSEHISHIFDEKELTREATVRNFRTVQSEGKRQVERNRDFYNLDELTRDLNVLANQTLPQRGKRP